MCASPALKGTPKETDMLSGDNCGLEPHQEQNVKSTAVVKYSAVQFPANFAQLQCNTDLNLPPSNWLSSTAESYGLQHVLSHSTGFSSFRMAHMFPDCMGEVDVVSDAENVKKLLKIPYSRGPVSMMVHRIENTLLIDEFDIHKHLLRQAENDWVWLRKFFYEHVLQSLNDKDKGVTVKNNSRYVLQQKSLISKFLHHSLAEPIGEPPDRLGEDEQEEEAPPEEEEEEATANKSRKDPPLPEPSLEEEVPDPTTNHKYARNVVWTFEDIQMLLGTDMPIFGGSTHPCISLRLRDMTKPISVLTGIDYWLDNLMCNVPEVVMCYHLDGIVQRYELIKTEDLPQLPGSKFSPKLIRDVAQNILSFLKANATKAGHTYWLFKGRDDDVVKLYDLTSLCSEGLIEKGQNPFTIPVAMLLYRVARNMKHHSSNSQPGTIRMLLKNCLALLPKEKYPQIVTSAHYMLSDLYVPVTTDPTCPGLNDEQLTDEEQHQPNSEEEYECEEQICSTTNSVAVKSLCISNSAGSKYSDPPAPPLVGSVEERCQMALQHVAAGLQCLQYFEGPSTKHECHHKEEKEDSACKCNSFMDTKAANGEVEEEPKLAQPFQAIPMPYAPINGDRQRQTKGKKKRGEASLKKEKDLDEDTTLRALLCRPQAEPLPTWQQPETMDNASWNAHLKTLLYEKACLVYITLAEREYNSRKYGMALRHIQSVLRCNCRMVVKNRAFVSYLLGRAGDCCFLLAKHWSQVDVHLADFTSQTDVDREIEEVISKDISPVIFIEECKMVPATLESSEQLLVVGCQLYGRALFLAPGDNLRRRLGNIHNELGSFYMNQAAVMQTSPPTNLEAKIKYDDLFKAAQAHLEEGVEQFESVSDDTNLALLHSNTGRLMRLLAHYQQYNFRFTDDLGDDNDDDENDDSENRKSAAAGTSKAEKYYYNKAFVSYQKALTVIGSRKVNPLVWDTINWELSSALYAHATIMQDWPPPITSVRTKEEVEREVIELLQKALKYCDVETAGPRQPMYQFRAGMLHYRLACLYHKMYRNVMSGNDENQSRRKSILQLCVLNYERAARILMTVEYPSDYLRVQLERVALSEFQAENNSGATSKVKHYQHAINVFVQCRPMLEVMKSSSASYSNDRDGNPSNRTAQDSDIEKRERQTENDLLALMENRLQFLLRTLTKLCLTNSQSKISELGPLYKEAYNVLLKRKDNTTLVEHLFSVLNYLSQHGS